MARVLTQSFKSKDGKRSYKQKWYARKLADGTVEAYEVEETAPTRKADRFVVVNGHPHLQSELHPRHPGRTHPETFTKHWTFSQIVWVPGDWAHNNGECVNLYRQATRDKALAKLRRLGFRAVTRDELGEMRENEWAS